MKHAKRSKTNWLLAAGLFEHNWGDVEVQRMLLAVMAMPFCLREDGSDEPA